MAFSPTAGALFGSEKSHAEKSPAAETPTLSDALRSISPRRPAVQSATVGAPSARARPALSPATFTPARVAAPPGAAPPPSLATHLPPLPPLSMSSPTDLQLSPRSPRAAGPLPPPPPLPLGSAALPIVTAPGLALSSLPSLSPRFAQSPDSDEQPTRPANSAPSLPPPPLAALPPLAAPPPLRPEPQPLPPLAAPPPLDAPATAFPHRPLLSASDQPAPPLPRSPSPSPSSAPPPMPRPVSPSPSSRAPALAPRPVSPSPSSAPPPMPRPVSPSPSSAAPPALAPRSVSPSPSSSRAAAAPPALAPRPVSPSPSSARAASPPPASESAPVLMSRPVSPSPSAAAPPLMPRSPSPSPRSPAASSPAPNPLSASAPMLPPPRSPSPTPLAAPSLLPRSPSPGRHAAAPVPSLPPRSRSPTPSTSSSDSSAAPPALLPRSPSPSPSTNDASGPRGRTPYLSATMPRSRSLSPSASTARRSVVLPSGNVVSDDPIDCLPELVAPKALAALIYQLLTDVLTKGAHLLKIMVQRHKSGLAAFAIEDPLREVVKSLVTEVASAGRQISVKISELIDSGHSEAQSCLAQSKALSDSLGVFLSTCARILLRDSVASTQAAVVSCGKEFDSVKSAAGSLNQSCKRLIIQVLNGALTACSGQSLPLAIAELIEDVHSFDKQVYDYVLAQELDPSELELRLEELVTRSIRAGQLSGQDCPEAAGAIQGVMIALQDYSSVCKTLFYCPPNPAQAWEIGQQASVALAAALENLLGNHQASFSGSGGSGGGWSEAAGGSSSSLGDEAKQRSRRERAAREIYSTEDTYKNNLSKTFSLYMVQLKRRVGELLTPEEFNALFGSLHKLIPLHKNLWQTLEQQLEQAGGSYADVCLGQIFLAFAPSMFKYSDFINTFDKRLKVLAQLQKSPKFVAFLAETQANEVMQNLDIAAFLIQPIQRLPRYEMLLKELVKSTPPQHPDHAPLEEALVRVRETNAAINAAKREYENLEKISHFQAHMYCESGPVPIVYEGPRTRRTFLKAADLQVIHSTRASASAPWLRQRECRKTAMPRHVLLFDDTIIFTTEDKKSHRLQVHQALSLAGASIKPTQRDEISGKRLPEEPLDQCLSLAFRTSLFIVCFKTKSEFAAWRQLLSTLCK